MGKTKYKIKFADPLVKEDGTSDYAPFTNEPNDLYVTAELYAHDEEELFNLFDRVCDRPLGMWYWVTDETKNTVIVSGACDPGDVEVIKEYLGYEE